MTPCIRKFGFGFMALGLLAWGAIPAFADVTDRGSFLDDRVRILDYLEIIPAIRIPRRFLIEGQYTLELNADNMTLGHQVRGDQMASRQRRFVISFAYGATFGPDFTTDLRVPLFCCGGEGQGITRVPFGTYDAQFGMADFDEDLTRSFEERGSPFRAARPRGNTFGLLTSARF